MKRDRLCFPHVDFCLERTSAPIALSSSCSAPPFCDAGIPDEVSSLQQNLGQVQMIAKGDAKSEPISSPAI